MGIAINFKLKPSFVFYLFRFFFRKESKMNYMISVLILVFVSLVAGVPAPGHNGLKALKLARKHVLRLEDEPKPTVPYELIVLCRHNPITCFGRRDRMQDTDKISDEKTSDERLLKDLADADVNKLQADADAEA